MVYFGHMKIDGVFFAAQVSDENLGSQPMPVLAYRLCRFEELLSG